MKSLKSREITKQEIKLILKHEKCKPREKAIFSLIAQSGIRPEGIKKLRIDDVECLLEQISLPAYQVNVQSNSRINVPTFVGEETIKFIRDYFKSDRTETNLKSRDYLFTSHNDKISQINTKNLSGAFNEILRELIKEGKIILNKGEKGEPNELRLYTLVNFYRIKAKFYLKEMKKARAEKDIEFCRKLYSEKALPDLQIDVPTEIQQLRIQQYNQASQIRELNIQLGKIETRMNQDNDFNEYLSQNPEQKDWLEQKIFEEKFEKWAEEHPEEYARQNEEYLRTHPNVKGKKIKNVFAHAFGLVYDDNKYLRIRVSELERRINDIAKTVSDASKKP
jgi:hypothetical protein